MKKPTMGSAFLLARAEQHQGKKAWLNNPEGVCGWLKTTLEAW
jgi:hypothetical protein